MKVEGQRCSIKLHTHCPYRESRAVTLIVSGVSPRPNRI